VNEAKIVHEPNINTSMTRISERSVEHKQQLNCRHVDLRLADNDCLCDEKHFSVSAAVTSREIAKIPSKGHTRFAGAV
jgi:hypothetical protein